MANKDSKNDENRHRMIYFKGNFNEDTAHSAIERLFEYEAEDPKKDILIYIDSYGGYVDSFIAIHDAMRLIQCRVATVCVGKAMSCGQMLLMSGTPGLRFITPNSRVMMHQISSMTYGRVSDMQVDIDEDDRLQTMFENLIVKYTKIKKKSLREMLKQDCYFSAGKALELGFVDKILKNNIELSKLVRR